MITEGQKFEAGTIVMTAGVQEDVIKSLYAGEEPSFKEEINACLLRHLKGDWGDLCDEDKKANDEALNPDTVGRVMSSYITSCGEVWIITEWDRSATTILYPDEY